MIRSCYVKALHINLSRAKWCGMEMRERQLLNAYLERGGRVKQRVTADFEWMQ